MKTRPSTEGVKYTNDHQSFRVIVERRALWGRKITKRMGSNPGHSPREDWASTRGNVSQMGGLQIGGLH